MELNTEEIKSLENLKSGVDAESEEGSECIVVEDVRFPILNLIQLFITKNLIKEITTSEVVEMYEYACSLDSMDDFFIIIYDNLWSSFREIRLNYTKSKIDFEKNLKDFFYEESTTFYVYLTYNKYSLTTGITSEVKYNFQHLITEILISCKAVTEDTEDEDIICIFSYYDKWGLYYYDDSCMVHYDHPDKTITYKNLDEYVGFQIQEYREVLNMDVYYSYNFTHFTFEFVSTHMSLI